jgi:nicotinate-nucleotide adenylyltransferase
MRSANDSGYYGSYGGGSTYGSGRVRRKAGILGGTFDPVHIGHLILAEEAWFQLGLDRVYLVPAGDPPHKRDRRLAAVEHRVRMAELATADVDYAMVSRVDADRPGPHYTVDMVQLLEQQEGPDTDLYFLMGMDSLRDLPTWYKADWLVEHVRLVALSRHDVALDWEQLETALPGVRRRVIILDMPELEIASHVLQERVRRGQPIRHQVPRAVEAYIHKHNLYRTALAG